MYAIDTRPVSDAVANTLQENYQDFRVAGGFLRKYRPMFEAAVPAWAAKANMKLRATFTAKKRDALAARRERAVKSNLKSRPTSTTRRRDALAAERERTVAQSVTPCRSNERRLEDWEEEDSGEEYVEHDGGEHGEDEDEDEDDDEHDDGEIFQASPLSPLSDDLRPSKRRRPSPSAESDICFVTDGWQSPLRAESSRRSRRSRSSDIVALDSPPPKALDSPPPAPHNRPLPPPVGPICEADCRVCVHQGYLHVSHGRLRNMMHDKEAQIQRLENELAILRGEDVL
jgi:hypothetical protein